MYGLLPFNIELDRFGEPDLVAALGRFDSEFLLGHDYVGFDILVLINMLNDPLLDPMLGVDPAGTDEDFVQELLIGGWENDPLFGGSGPQVMSQLDSFGVFATLIPENGTIFNLSLNGRLRSGITLDVGDIAYISSVPVPAAIWLFGTALIGLIGFSKRRNAA